MNDPKQRIAIVGAGMAGVTARYRLAAAGFHVETFDKGRGPGGRTSRRRTDSGEFDHGAQYFTVRSPEFRALVERWSEEGTVARWNPRIGTLREGAWRDATGESPRYVGVPGMNQPAKNLAVLGDEAGAPPIRLGTRIVEARDERPAGAPRNLWYLRDAADALHGPYGSLILTVPPPQALDLLPGSSAAVPLLRDVKIDPCWAVMALYERPPMERWDAVFLEGGILSWAARNSSKPGRPPGEAWVLHASPRWSRENLELDPREVIRILTAELPAAVADGRSDGAGSARAGSAGARAVGARSVGGVPLATWAAAHRWRYARPRRQGESPRRHGEVARPPFWWNGEERLGLAGDWFCGGRVECAFLSGHALAGGIAAALAGPAADLNAGPAVGPVAGPSTGPATGPTP
ncbi:MAG: FAD-dependent oxidoreductase [Spirochaetaceae bacterium]|nr:MAG: FAD-dependent oxidoreductase [Spirochaetaceae bacterium]